MKQLLSLVFCLFSGFLFSQGAIQIIPAPASVTEGTGFFSLKKGDRIGYEQAEASWAAGYLAEELNRSTGYGLKTVQSKVLEVFLLPIRLIYILDNKSSCCVTEHLLTFTFDLFCNSRQDSWSCTLKTHKIVRRLRKL
jgi:hypothetical protein